MNCPINEQTGDGVAVGRCWFHLPDGKTCPRHGDVSNPVNRYNDVGRLTLESEHCRSSSMSRKNEKSPAHR